MTNCVRVSQTTGVGEAMTPPAGLCLHNFICTLHKALLIKVIESIFSFSCIGIWRWPMTCYCMTRRWLFLKVRLFIEAIHYTMFVSIILNQFNGSVLVWFCCLICHILIWGGLRCLCLKAGFLFVFPVFAWISRIELAGAGSQNN